LGAMSHYHQAKARGASPIYNESLMKRVGEKGMKLIKY
jgi:hypothetical protein